MQYFKKVDNDLRGDNRPYGETYSTIINLNTATVTGDAPIIGIGRLVRCYRPIVVYTIGEFYFYYQKEKKRESGFRFR